MFFTQQTSSPFLWLMHRRPNLFFSWLKYKTVGPFPLCFIGESFFFVDNKKPWESKEWLEKENLGMHTHRNQNWLSVESKIRDETKSCLVYYYWGSQAFMSLPGQNFAAIAFAEFSVGFSWLNSNKDAKTKIQQK